MINNYILGNIRIMEGTAVNQADFSIARILVKAQILDAYAVVLGERESYAGNVLTDEELTNMSEEEILQRLSLPEGRDNLNERVIPNGQYPFYDCFHAGSAGHHQNNGHHLWRRTPALAHSPWGIRLFPVW